jgi:lysophospholipase L1-like esterase
MTRRNRGRRNRRLFFWVLLLLLTGGSTFFLGEGLLRAVRWAGGQALEAGLFQYDPALRWDLKPGFEGSYSGVPCRITSYGIRGDPARGITDKQEGELRILCLGDSRTFGYGVREEESYPSLLQQTISARLPATQVTVINAGIPGYSSYQGRVWLAEKGMALAPDMILAGFSVNDRRAVEDPEHQDGPVQFQEKYRSGGWDRRLNGLFLYRFAKKLLLLARYTEQSSFSILDWRLRVPEDRYRENISEICRMARESSIPLLLLAMEDYGPYTARIRKAAGALARGTPEKTIEILEGIPSGQDFFTPMVHYYREEAAAALRRPVPAPFRRYLLFDAVEGGPSLRADCVYDEALKQAAAGWGVPVLDVGVLLGGEPENYLDFCHFSPAGNGRIAEAVADRFLATAGH